MVQRPSSAACPIHSLKQSLAYSCAYCSRARPRAVFRSTSRIANSKTSSLSCTLRKALGGGLGAKTICKGRSKPHTIPLSLKIKDLINTSACKYCAACNSCWSAIPQQLSLTDIEPGCLRRLESIIDAVARQTDRIAKDKPHALNS